jgi:hypothetical protein
LSPFDFISVLIDFFGLDFDDLHPGAVFAFENVFVKIFGGFVGLDYVDIEMTIEFFEGPFVVTDNVLVC